MSEPDVSLTIRLPFSDLDGLVRLAKTERIGVPALVLRLIRNAIAPRLCATPERFQDPFDDRELGDVKTIPGATEGAENEHPGS